MALQVKELTVQVEGSKFDSRTHICRQMGWHLIIL